MAEQAATKHVDSIIATDHETQYTQRPSLSSGSCMCHKLCVDVCRSANPVLDLLITGPCQTAPMLSRHHQVLYRSLHAYSIAQRSVWQLLHS